MICLSLLSAASAACTHEPACFKRGFFNFDLPPEGLYNVVSGDLTVGGQSLVLGYGDFNNDFYNDVLVASPLRNAVTAFIWNIENSLFVPLVEMPVSTCQFSNVYILDADYDGFLDFSAYCPGDEEALLQTYLGHGDGSFTKEATSKVGLSQPFLADVDLDLISQYIAVGLEGCRVVLQWRNNSKIYLSLPWERFFPKDYACTPFLTPHFNAFVDLTGDCRPDTFVMSKSGGNLIAEIYTPLPTSGFELARQLTLSSAQSPPLSVNFGDLNYDGLPDLLIMAADGLSVFFSQVLKPVKEVCSPGYSVVTLQSQSQLIAKAVGEQQQVHLADLDYNGFLDIVTLLQDQVTVFFGEADGDSFPGVKFTQDRTIIQLPAGIVPTAVSVFDILEDGILDLFLEIKRNGQQQLLTFLNNTGGGLFFLKAHSINGASKTGSLCVGSTFAWRISLFSGELRYTHMPEITLSAFLPKQAPFSSKGLGRATNYVEDLSVGLSLAGPDGVYSWTPIIPNSQLIVGRGGDQWSIRAFIKPTDALIWVVVVSVIILAVLAAVMFCLYMREKEEDRLFSRNPILV